MNNPLLSIIVPIFNEDRLVASALPLIFNLPIDKEVIIVNDGSTDDTAQALNDLAKIYNFQLTSHITNQGKGAAVRKGLEKVKGRYFVICDADSEYDPSDLIMMLSEITKYQEPNIALYGSRWLSGQPRGWHYRINWFLTTLTNWLFSGQLTDMETCFKMVPVVALNKINLRGRRFEIEPEITAQLLKSGFIIKEVPINYRRRGYKEGKKIKPRDGLQAILTLLKEKLYS